MLCKWCCQHNQIPKSGDKTWTKVPSTNFRQDAVARHASSQSHAVAAALEVNRLEAISRKTEINNSLVAHEGEVKLKLHCRIYPNKFVNL